METTLETRERLESVCHERLKRAQISRYKAWVARRSRARPSLDCCATRFSARAQAQAQAQAAQKKPALRSRLTRATRVFSRKRIFFLFYFSAREYRDEWGVSLPGQAWEKPAHSIVRARRRRASSSSSRSPPRSHLSSGVPISQKERGLSLSLSLSLSGWRSQTQKTVCVCVCVLKETRVVSTLGLGRNEVATSNSRGGCGCRETRAQAETLDRGAIEASGAAILETIGVVLSARAECLERRERPARENTNAAELRKETRTKNKYKGERFEKEEEEEEEEEDVLEHLALGALLALLAVRALSHRNFHTDHRGFKRALRAFASRRLQTRTRNPDLFSRPRRGRNERRKEMKERTTFGAFFHH